MLPLNSEFPVVVIGSGFGGLAAAIRLRAMGHRVTLVEAGSQPGGRARVFHQDGFSFDAGPTVITAPYLLDELWALCGRDRAEAVELLPVDPFYRVMFPDGTVFDYVGEEERILDQIRRISPRDVDGYRRLARHSEQIFDVGYTGLAGQPFDRLSEMLRVVPDMIRLESYRTVFGLVSRYIHDPRLRQAFTFQPLLVGGNPLRTTSIYLLIHWLERKWGVWYVKGGTQALVHAMVQLLDDIGVEIHYDSPVERIEVQDGRATAVEIADGRRIPCSFVVSNADPSVVYTQMIDASQRRWHTDGAVARKKQSMSLFVTYLGADRSWPELAHHSILLGPRYEGLLGDIFDRKVLAQDFSLYLHTPTRTDPSMAPPGHENLYALAPVPNLKSGIRWEDVHEEYEDRILSFLDRGPVPGLKAHLVTKKSIDPRYFRDELRSRDGAAFGIEPVLTQSAWFRYHNRSEDVQGLYFVGASTHPGAGVPGVLCGAKVLEKVVPRPQQVLPLPGAQAAAR